MLCWCNTIWTCWCNCPGFCLCLLFGSVIRISAGLYLWLRLICLFECQICCAVCTTSRFYVQYINCYVIMVSEKELS
jgi:hypothetical protein